jgi:hypothetical protein
LNKAQHFSRALLSSPPKTRPFTNLEEENFAQPLASEFKLIRWR